MEKNLLHEIQNEEAKLIKEKGEYEKYNNLMKHTIDNLIHSNEQLLLSLKLRFKKFAKLNRKDLIINTNIFEKFNIVNKKEMEVSEISSLEKSTVDEYVISSARKLNHIKKDLEVVEFDEEDIFSQINDLQNRKEMLLNEQQELKKSICFMKEQNKENVFFTHFIGEFNQFQKIEDNCEEMRKQILNFKRNKVSSLTNKKSKSHFYLEPLKLFEMLNIGLSQNVSLSSSVTSVKNYSTELKSNTENNFGSTINSDYEVTNSSKKSKLSSLNNSCISINIQDNNKKKANQKARSENSNNSLKCENTLTKNFENSNQNNEKNHEEIKSEKEDISAENIKALIGNENEEFNVHSEKNLSDPEMHSIKFHDSQISENEQISNKDILENISQSENSENVPKETDSLQQYKSIIENNTTYKIKIQKDDDNQNPTYKEHSDVHQEKTDMLLSPIDPSNSVRDNSCPNNIILSKKTSSTSMNYLPKLGNELPGLKLNEKHILVQNKILPNKELVDNTPTNSSQLSPHKMKVSHKFQKSNVADVNISLSKNSSKSSLKNLIISSPRSQNLTQLLAIPNSIPTNSQVNKSPINSGRGSKILMKNSTFALQPIDIKPTTSPKTQKIVPNVENKVSDNKPEIFSKILKDYSNKLFIKKELQDQENKKENNNSNNLNENLEIYPIGTHSIENKKNDIETNMKNSIDEISGNEENDNYSNNYSNEKSQNESQDDLLEDLKNNTENNSKEETKMDKINNFKVEYEYNLYIDQMTQTLRSFILMGDTEDETKNDNKIKIHDLRDSNDSDRSDSSSFGLDEFAMKKLDLQKQIIDIELDNFGINQVLNEKKQNENKKIADAKLDLDLNVVHLMRFRPNQKNPHSDAHVQTIDELPDLEELKKEILNFSTDHSEFLMMEHQKKSLEKMLQGCHVELKLTKMRNKRKELDLDLYKKRLKIVDPLRYYQEFDLPPEEAIDPELWAKKLKKHSKVDRLIYRIDEICEENEDLAAKIKDLTFVTDQLLKKLTLMSMEPRSNVRNLCANLKYDKSVITEILRQNSFLEIEYDFVCKKIAKINEKYNQDNIKLLNESNQKTYRLIKSLKMKFDILRAVKEKRTKVLTSEEEMRQLVNKRKDLFNLMEILKMKTDGVISRITKELRSINSMNIRIPEPPSFFDIQTALGDSNSENNI
ncbi:hypothetical protein TRFO_35861 [Tritrichomonas foetus]|uniref:DUF4201 domain-containing protein n=1 Tax=Tritrichomonas foetus TaxID=1144522 RepID=A0A1J4JJY6_9EUKA|nr:hypothetical protein TRFO_35861 [Tritrichomonas foetus]|eukprot:OHS97869.1 hypothetical protein TRFO_35861 [Tritrichomonas foetus]